MSDFFRNIIKDLDDGNTSVVEDNLLSSEFSGTVDTGCYILNAVLSGSIFGGVPNNKITVFAGEPASGKTFFCLNVIRQFLNDNPTGAVFYFDTEAAVTRNMMKSRGIDTNRVIVSEQDSVQKFRHTVLQILEKYKETKEKDRPPMMMVLDSVGQLSTVKELEDTAAGKDTKDMTRAQMLKATFRVLTLKLAKVDVPLLVTNHVYDVVGSYIPMKEMGGGSGLKYSASQVLFLGKKKDRDGTDVTGNIVKVTMNKSRFTKEFKKIEVLLSYETGLDRYYGLLPLAEKYGLFQKVSNKYELPDGTKAFEKAINKNPEKYFTPEILQQLDGFAAKEFLYGVDIEEDTAIEEKESTNDGEV